MAGAPWYKRYPGDWKAATGHLSHEERSMHLNLLDAAWVRADGTCRIPDDDVQLARICEVGLRRWRARRERILSLWISTDDGYLRSDVLVAQKSAFALRTLRNQRDAASKRARIEANAALENDPKSLISAKTGHSEDASDALLTHESALARAGVTHSQKDIGGSGTVIHTAGTVPPYTTNMEDLSLAPRAADCGVSEPPPSARSSSPGGEAASEGPAAEGTRPELFEGLELVETEARYEPPRDHDSAGSRSMGIPMDPGGLRSVGEIVTALISDVGDTGEE